MPAPHDDAAGVAMILDRLHEHHEQELTLLRQIAERPTVDRLSIGIGSWRLSAGGMGVILFLGMVAIIGAVLSSGYRIERAMVDEGRLRHQEHIELGIAQARSSCIQTMTPEERSKFRDTFSNGAWQRWCPWVQSK